MQEGNLPLTTPVFPFAYNADSLIACKVVDGNHNQESSLPAIQPKKCKKHPYIHRRRLQQKVAALREKLI